MHCLNHVKLTRGMQKAMEMPVMLSTKYKRAQEQRLKIQSKPESKPEPKPEIKKTISIQIKPIEQETEKESKKEILEPLFVPFELKETSSFNPKKLTVQELSKLDPRTRAKYLAYANPSPEIQSKITTSELRSRKILYSDKQRIQQLLLETKKKYDLLHRAKEDPEKLKIGIELANKAKQRIVIKRELLKTAREEDLQYLIEGQKTSIEAIKLKEHLVVKRMPRSELKLSEKEKARIEVIMSSDYVFPA